MANHPHRGHAYATGYDDGLNGGDRRDEALGSSWGAGLQTAIAAYDRGLEDGERERRLSMGRVAASRASVEFKSLPSNAEHAVTCCGCGGTFSRAECSVAETKSGGHLFACSPACEHRYQYPNQYE